MTQWCNKWRIKVNEEKSNVVIFTQRRPNITAPLKLNNKEIQYSSHVKYLGVQLDSKLTWKTHINYTRRKTLQRIHQLYPLLTSPALHLHKKMHLFKSLILPVILYASPAWGSAAKTHVQSLQVLQNKVLRIISGADIYTRISQLHEDLHCNYILQEIQQAARKLYSSVSENSNPLISNIGNYKITTHDRHRMPKYLLNQTSSD